MMAFFDDTERIHNERAEQQRQADLARMKARGEVPYLKVSTKPDQKLIENPYNPSVDPKYQGMRPIKPAASPTGIIGGVTGAARRKK